VIDASRKVNRQVFARPAVFALVAEHLKRLLSHPPPVRAIPAHLALSLPAADTLLLPM
jgi:hypothetical protein